MFLVVLALHKHLVMKVLHSKENKDIYLEEKSSNFVLKDFN